MATKRKGFAKQLRTIYRRVLSSVPVVRIAALTEALHCYDQALKYRSGLDKRKSLEENQEQEAVAKAILARAQAVRAVNGQQEALLLSAIRAYELAFVQLRLPKVAQFYKQYQQKEDGLAQKQVRSEERAKGVLDLLTYGLRPVNSLGESVSIVVELTVSGSTPRYSFDVQAVVYSGTDLRRLRDLLRHHGMLAVLFDQLPFLSRAAALLPDGYGQYAYDATAHVASVTRMLQNVLDYCTSEEAPRKLVKCKFGGPRATSRG